MLVFVLILILVLVLVLDVVWVGLLVGGGRGI